ncbi:DUF1697 domain-containing protein [Qipengyuania sp.]|uniref:DUF1697 domain-containing protein n=1 Tax=Qipengyuania sp. TaxID=2004515 RepID=UPI0035C7A764
MPHRVALLGSINVGGNRLTMAELKAALEKDGFEDVSTVVASGIMALWNQLAPSRERSLAIADSASLLILWPGPPYRPSRPSIRGSAGWMQRAQSVAR